MERITLFEEYRLIERSESQINGVWKGTYYIYIVGLHINHSQLIPERIAVVFQTYLRCPHILAK
jgi:hypothetical protein